MGIEERGEFVVGTVEHCFICVEHISPRLPWPKSDSLSPSSIYSLQYLSRYLKLRLRSVFREEGLIPEYLLEKVERSTLKANLCEACASWNAKLSKLYRQLEKIELETLEHLQTIHGKLLKADKDGKTALLNKLADHSSTSEVMGKLEIAETLRKDTILKYSQKLSKIRPKVKVPILTENEILHAKKLKTNDESPKTSSNNMDFLAQSTCKDLPNSETKLLGVKLENNEVRKAIMPDECENSLVEDFGSEQSDGFENADMDLSTTANYTGNDPLATCNETKQQNYVKNKKTGKFKCDICSKEFANSFTFQRHYKSVHLNIRFKCKICNNVFSHKDNLRAHQDVVHLKIRFNCDICGLAFARRSKLTRHQRRVHLKQENKE